MTVSYIVPFSNGDFTAGEAGWTIARDRGEAGVVVNAATGGRPALRIVADKARNGAKVESALALCRAPGVIELRGRVCAVSGRSLGLWIREYDAAGALLPSSQANWGELGGNDGKWHDLIRRVVLDARTAALQLFFLAYPQENERIDVYVADLSLVRLPMPIPPYPGQYKLRADEHDRLTAADVPGSDGVVYPNWRNVGVPGGIPDAPAVLRLEARGARPETDISGLLDAACEEAGAAGGGAVLIGRGTYYLDRPVLVRRNGVVIRGAGRGETKLVFRYSLANPGAELPRGWPPPAVFAFNGRMDDGDRLLAADARRGATAITLREAGDLKPGDKFLIRAPSSDRWRGLTGDRSTVGWGVRINAYEAVAVQGNTVEIGQPLRIDFPVADGSYIRRVTPVERCGIEDLTIDHACRMAFHTVHSHWAWACWVRRVDVLNSGGSGVHFHSAKQCEVRDCTFTGFDPAVHKAHVNYFGYGGFTCAWDCLMEDTVWKRFRHAPQVQFGAQGNVIRNSVFEGSDAQWHAGWSTENLFENCRNDARGAYGSYGHGAYATGSDDTTHGPNGPRNAVYNCDFICATNGVLLNGVNENWLFLHNRFTVEKGAGFVATCGCFDHIIRNNRFILKNTAFPLLRLRTPDCVGVELVDNVLFGGNGTLVESAAPLAADRDNRVAAPDEPPPERPRAAPPSIYEWQRGGR